jgi:tetratricopeptide (TPR) repeat protein
VALEIATRLSNDGSRAINFHCLGNRYADLGDIDQARRNYNLALGLYDSLLAAATSHDNRRALLEIKEERALLLDNIASLQIDEKQFSESMKSATTAYVIGDELSSALVQSAALCLLTRAYLCVGSIMLARTEIDKARKFDVPELKHEVFALLGLVAFRQKNAEIAQKAFLQAVEFGNVLTALNQSNYKALDCIGISECGLVACGLSERAELARTAYRSARKINSDKGVVNRFQSLLTLLNSDIGVRFADFLNSI